MEQTAIPIDIGVAPAKTGGSRLWVAKLYYLAFFASLGAMAPYFNLFLLSRGFSGTEIGLLGSIPPMISLAANPFWNGIADRWKIHRLVLATCVLMAGLVSFPFIWTTGFGPMLVLVIAMIFFRTPVMALVDSTVMATVAITGDSYGKQRLFGSIGFLAASLLLGRLLTPDTLSNIFVVQGLLLAVVCTGLSFLLPMAHLAEGEKGHLWAGLRTLARQRAYVGFLLMNILMGFGAACFINFVGLKMAAMGASESDIGFAFALNALTEIPIFFIGARLLARFGFAQLIIAGLIGLAIAYGSIGVATSLPVVFVMMSTIGFSFGAFWMAVVAFANETAPPGLRATGQSLVGAAQGGLGWALGAITGGILWDATNGTVVLLTGAVSLLAGALIFWIGQRQPPQRVQPQPAN
ncbi:MAG: MFS transporter [Anaerolineales bacterium]|nr:MFS transporter [Anaerolineales bacterium]